MPATAVCAELEEFVVAFRDDRYRRLGWKPAVDHASNLRNERAVQGLRTARMRLPDDSPLLLEAHLVRLEQFAVPAAREEITKGRLAEVVDERVLRADNP